MTKTLRRINEPRLRLADSLELPLDVVTQRLAWLGRTGSGKTYGAMKLAELLLEVGAQIVVFDIPGHWSGLRLGPLPFAIPVFGGVRGDIPLEPTAGAPVADLVVDRGISVILDVSLMDDPELWRFAADFTSRFFVRKQTSPSPVHVFYDECQELVPQEYERAQKPVLNAINRQQKRTRYLGVGVSLISQRPQEVNKRVLDQAECVFAFQMSGRLEREEIGRRVATSGLEKTSIMKALPKLPVGTAHVWSPQWLNVSKQVKILEKRTPDVSATPKVGDRDLAPKQLSPVDLADLRESMVASIDRAKQDDPRELRKRIAELESLVRGKSAPPPKPERIEVPVLSEKTLAALTQLVRANESLSHEIHEALERFSPSGPSTAPIDRTPMPASRSSKVIVATDARAARRASQTTGVVGASGLRRILTALAQRPQGLSMRQIAVRAGLSSRSGTFSTYMSRARSNHWIDGRADHVRITEAGIAALGSYEPLPTGRALLDHWVAELGTGGVSRILTAVWSAYPNSLSLAQAAEAAGLSAGSGTFSTYVSRLRALELVHGRGQLTASDELIDQHT